MSYNNEYGRDNVESNFNNLSIDDDKQRSFQADRSGSNEQEDEGWSKTKIAGVAAGALAGAAAIGGAAYGIKKYRDGQDDEEQNQDERKEEQNNEEENKEGEWTWSDIWGYLPRLVLR